MPDLDVSFMTVDSMFADTFDVARRSDPVNNKGRTVPVTTQDFLGVTGTVTQQDPADLMRREDGQMVPRMIFIATPFQIRGASTGIQPDRITWNGTVYTVVQVYSYSRFGAGIYEVVAEAMNATDTAQ
jgi:galactose-6-phosphate isomerase